MNYRISFFRGLSLLALSALLSACSGGYVTPNSYNMGVSGSAAGGNSVGADASLQRCAQPLGTIAIDDGRKSSWYGNFQQATGVTDIEPLLRLAIQQSNCFVITSIGNQETDERLARITELQRNSGEYRPGSKQEKGQRVAADYYLEPKIIIDNDTISGVGGMLAGSGNNYLGAASLLAGLAGSQVSVVNLSLFDVRSAVQLSASEGSATSTNFSAVFGGIGSNAAGGVGGFSQTAAGKATLVAFVDSWNKMVIALRNYRSQSVEGGLGQGGLLKVE